MKSKRSFVVVLLLVVMRSAIAYETQTHALITAKAYERSTLAHTGEGSVVSRLLLDRLHTADPFKTYWTPLQRSRYFTDHVYYSINPEVNSSLDTPANFERCQMRQFLGLPDNRAEFRDLFYATVEPENSAPLLDIRNWLVRSAIREDDMGHSLIGLLGLRGSRCASFWFDTVNDQPGAGVRPLNHFYDPVYHIGLTTNPLIEGLKSVDWALGYQNSFVVPAQPGVGVTRNTYSYSAEPAS